MGSDSKRVGAGLKRVEVWTLDMSLDSNLSMS